LVLECQDAPDFFAGQFVNLQREDGLTRSYSISSRPQASKTLEFHIRRLPDGRFSEWAHNELKVGDTVAVSEPQGHCFYIPGRKQQSILLVGTGTGLAPLEGVLIDALAQGHTGLIHLFHGSSELEDLYRIDEMRELAEKHSNFIYTPCVSRGQVTDGFETGRANEIALNALSDLTDWRVFLCGHPDMIEQLKQDVIVKGVASSDVYIDAFHIKQGK
jgi:ferredoxin-NADP reductase